jgi:hypothetical protein
MGARYRPPCLARQPRPRCRNGCVACRRGIDAARADHICTVSNDNVGVLHDFLALVVVVQAAGANDIEDVDDVGLVSL